MAHHKKQLPTKTIQQYSNDWKTVSLNDTELFGFANGLWKGKKPPYITVKVLRNTNFNNDGTLDLSNVAELDVELNQFEKRKLIPGDIILERSGGGPFQPVGRVVYFNIEEGLYSFSNFTSRIRVENPTKIKPKFLLYSLLNFYNNGGTYELQQKTTGIRNLSFSEYIKISIPIPPLPEQKKIAAVLFRIQQAVETQEKILSSLQELKKSTMEYLFTHGTKGEKTKQTEIGEIPESWDIDSIGNLFDIQQGKSLSAKNQTGKYLKPFLRTANVLWGRLDLASIDEMDINPEERDKLCLKRGDLLICEGGDIGRTAIWQAEITECYCQNHVHRLRAKSNNSNSFFYMYWMYYAIKLFELYGVFGNRTTIPNLSQSRLKLFAVPKPGKDEQDKISGQLQIIDRKISAHKMKNKSLQELFNSMLNKLITGEIRVNDLDVEVKEVK